MLPSYIHIINQGGFYIILTCVTKYYLTQQCKFYQCWIYLFSLEIRKIRSNGRFGL